MKNQQHNPGSAIQLRVLGYYSHSTHYHHEQTIFLKGEKKQEVEKE